MPETVDILEVIDLTMRALHFYPDLTVALHLHLPVPAPSVSGRKIDASMQDLTPIPTQSMNGVHLYHNYVIEFAGDQVEL